MNRENIGIITMSYGTNYGNKLQNYAMQKIYQSLGFNVETIKLKPKNIKYARKKNSIHYYCMRLLYKFKCKLYKKNIIERIKKFDDFNKNMLNWSEEIYTEYTYKTIDSNKYSFISAGSDQIWNTYFDDFYEVFLLDFAKQDEKKIAYAPSFGVDTISKKYFEIFKENLNHFKAISIREESGKKLLKEKFNIDAPVVLDPTLLLEEKEWEKLIEKIDKRKHKSYVLTYYLGNVSTLQKKAIRKFAIKSKYEIIKLNDICNNYYSIDPIQFVYYIKNAKMVFTDSFHACCFSGIFEIPFWVVNRNSVKKDMNARIDTFLELGGLENRKWNKDSKLAEEINFSTLKYNVRKQRMSSLGYLKSALDIEE
ncbi:polysaccharide pyruvyl transferase family protein [uncultured Robinsoniella sp.]|uniref:polysaccharide pyruvyl transferase family protein n=1 Tax=uncultured Robinsoniella sp. TaxID=904190 RepID=UPI00374E9534